ncbi:unnamed protein product, partial [Iphiclides podalirius]
MTRARVLSNETYARKVCEAPTFSAYICIIIANRRPILPDSAPRAIRCDMSVGALVALPRVIAQFCLRNLYAHSPVIDDVPRWHGVPSALCAREAASRCPGGHRTNPPHPRLDREEWNGVFRFGDICAGCEMNGFNDVDPNKREKLDNRKEPQNLNDDPDEGDHEDPGNVPDGQDMSNDEQEANGSEDADEISEEDDDDADDEDDEDESQDELFEFYFRRPWHLFSSDVDEGYYMEGEYGIHDDDDEDEDEECQEEILRRYKEYRDKKNNGGSDDCNDVF